MIDRKCRVINRIPFVTFETKSRRFLLLATWVWVFTVACGNWPVEAGTFGIDV